MTKSEIATLKAISSNLSRVTRTSWESGDMAKWVEWAKLMRSEIVSNINLLDALAATAEEDIITGNSADGDNLTLK